MRRVVVGFSGGVTSAWCAGWALRNYPRDEVVLLFHDTKEEDVDTYRFNVEMAARLDLPITERSDGRSVSELFEGVDEIIKVIGFSAHEWQRVQRATAHAESDGIVVRFPLIEDGVTKQQCADWCLSMGVKEASMNSDWAAKKAEELAKVLDEIPWQKNDRYAILATALRDAARVPEGCVRTADGVDRKVLGTLPITADGCVPGLGASVSWPGYGEEYVYDGHVRYSLVWAASIPVESSTPVRDCYSTREAAESALTHSGRSS